MPQPAVILSKAKRYLTGVALLLSVVLLWTTSNFITADLETGEGSWNKPFLITYVNTASFVFYLIPTIWRYLLGRPLRPQHQVDEITYRPISQSPPSPRTTRRSTSITRTIPASPRASLHILDQSRSSSPVSPRAAYHPIDALPSSSPLTQVPHEEDEDLDMVLPDVDRPLSIRETAVIAAWWSAVWFVANYAVNASLGMTSVASVTILSSTSGFFTLGLGSYMGSEKVDPINGFAVVASFIGVILVTTSDSRIQSSSASDLPPYPLLGDMAALLSAAFYAVYVILLKVKVGNEDRADMQLMLGFAGLFNIVCLLPAFPLLHYSGWETFELPPTRTAWIICLVNMSITLSSDYLYMLAMLKTSPMLVTIGLSLTIPLALLGSLILPNTSSESITLFSIIGAALVFVGFGMLGWQGWKETQTIEDGNLD